MEIGRNVVLRRAKPIQANGDAALVPPAFNHFITILKKKTYEAMVNALTNPKPDIATDVLREFFVGAQVRNAKSGEREWTGLYLFGLQSYLEIFPEGAIEELPFGDMGFATSDEFQGGLESVVESLGKEFGKDNVAVSDVPRSDPKGNPIPWFRAVDVDASKAFSDAAHVWHMEFEPKANPRTRQQDLEGRYVQTKWVHDWTTVHAAVSARDIEAACRYAKSVGFDVTRSGDKACIKDPEGRMLKLETQSDRRQGVYRVCAGLNVSVPHPISAKMGEARLSIFGREAVLDFTGQK